MKKVTLRKKLVIVRLKQLENLVLSIAVMARFGVQRLQNSGQAVQQQHSPSCGRTTGYIISRSDNITDVFHELFGKVIEEILRRRSTETRSPRLQHHFTRARCLLRSSAAVWCTQR